MEMQEPQSLDTAVNNLLRMTQTQLGNLQNMLENQASLVDEAMAGEVDEYNRLVELVENTENKLQIVEFREAELRADLEEKNLAHLNELSTIKAKLTQARVVAKDFQQIKAELQHLRSMQPEKLKKKNIELQKLNKEKTEISARYRREHRDLKAQEATLKNQVANLTNLITEMNEEVEELRGRLMAHDGNVHLKPYPGKDGLMCYVYEFEWALTYKPFSPDINLLQDIKFHMEVRTNYGINVTVSITDWLQPFYPPCDYLADRWPEDIHDGLAERIIERLIDTHSHLIERVEWAQNTDLADVPGLTQRQLKILNDSHFYSLYAVCHIPATRLHTIVKGLGKKSAQAVRDICMNHVAEWEKQQKEAA